MDLVGAEAEHYINYLNDIIHVTIIFILFYENKIIIFIKTIFN